MTIGIGEGIGAAGTRVTKRLGPDDEIWLYVWQSIIGAAAIDVALTGVLAGCMIAGWWALSIFLGVVGFLIGLILLAYGRPRAPFWRIVFGNLWAAAAIVGLSIGHAWFGMIREGGLLIWEQVAVIFQFPGPVYALIAIALVAIWIKFDWRATLGAALAASIAYIAILSDWADWLAAWHNLKYLLIPYSWPVIGFALLLALVMGKEMLFPSLEWTLDPIHLEELREVGLIGLWVPGLFSKSNGDEPEEVLERRVRVEEANGGSGEYTKEAYTYLPDSSSARDFYRALSKGRPFTISEARRWHVGRRTFEKKIRDVFLDRGWAKWVNEEHHDQGLEITPKGHQTLEGLVLGDPRH